MKILLVVMTYVVIANTLTIENISRKIQKMDTQNKVLPQQIKEALLNETMIEQVKQAILNATMIEQVKQAILNGQLDETMIEQVKQTILNGQLDETMIEQVKQTILNGQLDETMIEQVKQTILNETMIEQVKQAILNGQVYGTGLYELLNMIIPTSPTPPYRKTLAYTLTIENIPRKRQKRNTQDEQIKDALLNGTALNETTIEYIKGAIQNGTLNQTIIEHVKEAILNGTMNGTGLYELLNITIATPPPPPTPFRGVTLPFDFWRPAATKASEIMNTLFQDSKFIYQQSEAHIKHVFLGLWRMGFIMWLGICQSTTSTTPLPTGWMREKLEKYYGKNFMDYGFG